MNLCYLAKEYTVLQYGIEVFDTGTMIFSKIDAFLNHVHRTGLPYIQALNGQWFKYLKKKTQTLNFIWNCKRDRTARIVLTKKNKDGGFTLPNLKTYYRSTVNKTVWYWHKYRHVDSGIELRVQK